MFDQFAVEKAQVVGDETVVRRGCGATEPINDGVYRKRIRITRLGHDAETAVLRDRARCPTVIDMFVPPFRRGRVVYVVAVEQSDQHIDIKKGSHSSVAGVFPQFVNQ